MTKVAYKWTDNQSRQQVDRKLSLPTSERSKVKLSQDGKTTTKVANGWTENQSRLRWTVQSKVIPKRE